VRNGVDYEKGCFVGQETVARVENVGRPSRRLVGVALPGVADGDALPATGAPVRVDGDDVGEVTRAAWSPHREAGIAFALVPYDAAFDAVTVAVDDAASGGEATDVAVLDGDVVSLPFVEGSDRSARIPTYD
jgi:aminomethyltransferase